MLLCPALEALCAGATEAQPQPDAPGCACCVV